MQQLIAIFERALRRLQVDIPPLRLEDLVVTVHRAMTAPGRNYHRIEHAFSLADDAQPLHTLAAFFHDIVYYQVDREIPPHLYRAIEAYIDVFDNAAGEITLSASPPAHDRAFAMALRVFDFSPGQTLAAATNMNEFLSTLVMIRKLAGLLSETDLLLVIVFIEATIPFRPDLADGSSHFDLLAQRLDSISLDYRLALNETQIEAMVQSAVLLANKDLQGFAAGDVRVFLDQTWQLLPETNVDLRIREGYSISAYRLAMQKMEAFLRMLKPGQIFCQYRGTPDNAELQRLLGLAEHNLQIGSAYLGIKLLAIAIIEALAAVTGGDVPLALFMGDIIYGDKPLQRFEDSLPAVKDGPWVDYSTQLGQVLKSGRAGTADFDIQDAPISLFLYRSISPSDIDEYLQLARRMFAAEISAQDFLSALDKTILSVLATACAEMVTTRRAALLAYTLGSH
jgi:hypothetical protein